MPRPRRRWRQPTGTRKVTSDRTIQEYVDEIWKLDKVVIPKESSVNMGSRKNK